MHSSLRSLGLVAAAILLAACPPSVPPTPSSAPEAEAVPVLKLTAIGTARADGSTGDLRASDLNASLRPAGAEGAIPRSVVIQLAVDVVGAHWIRFHETTSSHAGLGDVRALASTAGRPLTKARKSSPPSTRTPSRVAGSIA